MSTLREIRKAKKLSQTEVAVGAGVSIGTVSKMERGISVSKNSIRHVCSYLEIDPHVVDQLDLSTL